MLPTENIGCITNASYDVQRGSSRIKLAQKSTSLMKIKKRMKLDLTKVYKNHNVSSIIHMPKIVLCLIFMASFRLSSFQHLHLRRFPSSPKTSPQDYC